MFNDYVIPVSSSSQSMQQAADMLWTAKRTTVIVGSHISKFQHDLLRIDEDEPVARYTKGGLSVLLSAKTQLKKSQHHVEQCLVDLESVQNAAPIYSRFGSAVLSMTSGKVSGAECRAIEALNSAIQGLLQSREKAYKMLEYTTMEFRLPEECSMM